MCLDFVLPLWLAEDCSRESRLRCESTGSRKFWCWFSEQQAGPRILIAGPLLAGNVRLVPQYKLGHYRLKLCMHASTLCNGSDIPAVTNEGSIVPE